MVDNHCLYVLRAILPLLANRNCPKKDIAKVLWAMVEAFEIDPSDLDADDALIKLGLAKRIDNAKDDEVNITYLGWETP